MSNNCLYDEGIAKLVRVLLKTTAPLETLDLSKTCMSSYGAKLVAELTLTLTLTLILTRTLTRTLTVGAAPSQAAAAALPCARRRRQHALVGGNPNT